MSPHSDKLNKAARSVHSRLDQVGHTVVKSIEFYEFDERMSIIVETVSCFLFLSFEEVLSIEIMTATRHTYI